jgi:hypothetical protein
MIMVKALVTGNSKLARKEFDYGEGICDWDSKCWRGKSLIMVKAFVTGTVSVGEERV